MGSEVTHHRVMIHSASWRCQISAMGGLAKKEGEVCYLSLFLVWCTHRTNIESCTATLALCSISWPSLRLCSSASKSSRKWTTLTSGFPRRRLAFVCAGHRPKTNCVAIFSTASPAFETASSAVASVRRNSACITALTTFAQLATNPRS